MKLRYDKGLIFVDIHIEYKGKKKLVENVVLDTGAAHTIINPDSVYDLEVEAEASDEFITMYGIGGEHYAYRKKIDSVSIMFKELKDIEVDFGIIDEEGTINGLLGLDMLLKFGVNINLNKLILELDK